MTLPGILRLKLIYLDTQGSASVRDSVDADLDTWIRAMPAGVDPEVEAARQRISRIGRQFEHILRHAAADHDLTTGDWQALSVLHRSGPPYVLTPKELT